MYLGTNLSVKADVFPGSITPFILLTALQPFFLCEHIQKNKHEEEEEKKKKDSSNYIRTPF